MNKVIIIGGSAGSFKIVTKLISALPVGFPYPLVLCLHRLRSVRTGFSDALSANTKKNVAEPYDKELISNGKIYLAPANYHLMIEYGHRFSLSIFEPRNHSRPSIDILFETAGEVLKERLTAVILSGANSDGAMGAKKIKETGGTLIVQDPACSEVKTMPEACIPFSEQENILSSDKIINFILNL